MTHEYDRQTDGHPDCKCRASLCSTLRGQELQCPSYCIWFKKRQSGNDSSLCSACTQRQLFELARRIVNMSHWEILSAIKAAATHTSSTLYEALSKAIRPFQSTNRDRALPDHRQTTAVTPLHTLTSLVCSSRFYSVRQCENRSYSSSLSLKSSIFIF